MPYVMMPVPEEHVEEVMQFILRAIARAAIEPWDAASITTLFGEIDEPSRSLLSVVARAWSAGKAVGETEAADLIQHNPRETTGIMRELNELAKDLDHPALLWTRSVTETLPNGRTTDRRIMAVEDDVARLIRDAEKVELADADPMQRQA